MNIYHKNGSVIFSAETETRELVEAAIRAGADLTGAKFAGAKFTGADFTARILPGRIWPARLAYLIGLRQNLPRLPRSQRRLIL